MKAFCLIIFQLMLLFFLANAQSVKSYFDADSYAHTLSNDQYKIVFHVMPFGEQPGNIKYNQRYAWFNGNQLHFTQGGFSGKLLNGGYAEHFYGKGLKLQGTYKKGLMDGQWKSWREDGSLDSVLVYSSGIQNGQFEKYAADGLLVERKHYHNGLLNGKTERWVTKDSVQVVCYKRGKIYEKKPFKMNALLKKLIPFKKKHVTPGGNL